MTASVAERKQPAHLCGRLFLPVCGDGSGVYPDGVGDVGGIAQERLQTEQDPQAILDLGERGA